MTIRVLMYPHLDDGQPLPTNGISQVVRKYFEYLPKHGIELLPRDTDADTADIVAIHAGAVNRLPARVPVVAHNHGLYWTADQEMDIWTHQVNHTVINIVRRASIVTVPSNWVAKVFERDMHFKPVVIPHGVEMSEWEEGAQDEGYVLWNKNRASDACSPEAVNQLAARAPQTRFLTTYAAPNPRPNIRVTGTVDHLTMRDMILKCGVYLATTKETFGIGTLEAMAAGKPILGFNYGGTADLVAHGFSGYLARPGNYDDLLQGLEYCQKHGKTLGMNARRTASLYGWDHAAQLVSRQYALTVERKSQSEVGSVAVVIPCYNKAGTVLRAVRSVLAQTVKPDIIVVVNNNSTDDFGDQAELVHKEADAANVSIWITNCPEQGVAHARNFGIALTTQDYICCLDADDEMLPEFLEKCCRELDWDRSLGIAYTGMEVVNQEGGITVSQWPGEYNFDAVLKGRNQVPTCCLFRREAWVRAGGYRQRYAPLGAGSEDADLWLRIGLLGYGGKRAVAYPLFRYYLGGLVSGNPEYREKDWRGDKAWLATGQYPFAATFTSANNWAHPVRQYDQPEVSVIIPVHRNHIDLVWDAVDSIEAQTFRKWELILVADQHTRQDQAKWDRLQDAFPFVKFQTTYQEYRGAGAARNLGAELAKAPLMLALDADDWLTTDALSEMMAAHKEYPDAIVYSDYYGHAYMEDKAVLQRLRAANRLIDYNERTKEAKVLYEAFDFDCVRAQAQPIQGQDPYIWNVVTSLIPVAYFNEVKGFDINMDSWEDWDFFVRLAKAGKCFHHLNKPLLEYRFYTGQRRSLANPGESGEGGRQLASSLLQYMHDKYEGMENMPCTSCGGSRRSTPFPAPFIASNLNEGKMSNESADGMVLVELVDGNIGDHLIAFGGTSYNYRVHGDQFFMKREHAAVDRRVRVVKDAPTPALAGAQPLPPPPVSNIVQKAQLVTETAKQEGDMMVASGTIAQPALPTPRLPNPGPPAYDFVKLWGITEERADKLRAMGVRTIDGLIMLGAPKIAQTFDISEMIARRIMAEADKQKEADTKSRAGGVTAAKRKAAKRK